MKTLKFALATIAGIFVMLAVLCVFVIIDITVVNIQAPNIMIDFIAAVGLLLTTTAATVVMVTINRIA